MILIRRSGAWFGMNLRGDKPRGQGTTIVFITHDAIEAEKVIERVGILHRGELIVTGAPHVLKAEPQEHAAP